MVFLFCFPYHILWCNAWRGSVVGCTDAGIGGRWWDSSDSNSAAPSLPHCCQFGAHFATKWCHQHQCQPHQLKATTINMTKKLEKQKHLTHSWVSPCDGIYPQHISWSSTLAQVMWRPMDSLGFARKFWNESGETIPDALISNVHCAFVKCGPRLVHFDHFFYWLHGLSRLLIGGLPRTEMDHPTINHRWSIRRARILHFLQHCSINSKVQ